MVREADNTRARVALRGLLGGVKSASKGDDDEVDDEPPTQSTFHSRLRNDINDTLESGLQRRMKRIAQKVDMIHGTDWQTGSGNSGHTNNSNNNSTNHQQNSSASTRRLQRSLDMSLKHAERCIETKSLSFDPSCAQEELVQKRPDPQEAEEEVHKESVVLKHTLQSLRQSMASRERQIAALSQQLEDCTRMSSTCEQHVATVENGLKSLEDNRHTAEHAHTEVTNRRQKRVDDLQKRCDHVKAEAERYKSLSQQQRSFYTQNERVKAVGKRNVKFHPAGIIFLTPQPMSVADDKPDVWDVGTAVANPYVCDSWPFEPNVLARRSPEEGSMPTLEEETKEDLDDRLAFLRQRPLPNLPRRGGDDDDGPSETARSL